MYVAVITSIYHILINNYTQIYSDKWLEQGGASNTGVVSISSGTTITFTKPFKDTNYTFTLASSHSDTSNNNIGVQYGNTYYGCYYVGSKTATTIKVVIRGTWEAKGY